MLWFYYSSRLNTPSCNHLLHLVLTYGIEVNCLRSFSKILSDHALTSFQFTCNNDVLCDKGICYNGDLSGSAVIRFKEKIPPLLGHLPLIDAAVDSLQVLAPSCFDSLANDSTESLDSVVSLKRKVVNPARLCPGIMQTVLNRNVESWKESDTLRI